MTNYDDHRSIMLEKELEKIISELAETESRLSSGGLKSEEIEALSKKHSRLKTIVDTKHDLDAARAELAQTQSMLTDTDPAMAELAQADGIAQPRIGVCGLNPHAGEGGLLGYEETDLLNPVLDQLRGQFPGVSRCEPGDTLFARALRGEFDVVVALYHDQGLAPLKAVDFDEAVNVTLGLPLVRTSPDHGTAFGIAGKGVASGKSFANAVEAARRLIKFRAAR